eukprot:11032712-Alexandrium_andersonii.AAC.1
MGRRSTCRSARRQARSPNVVFTCKFNPSPTPGRPASSHIMRTRAPLHSRRELAQAKIATLARRI